MTIRTLGFLHPAENSALIDPAAFRTAGIEVVSTSSIAELRGMADSGRIPVVLVFADPAFIPLNRLEDLVLSAPRVQWIGLVAPGTLEDAGLRALVARNFFDYHTVPVNTDRLVAIVGHALGMAELLGPAPEGGPPSPGHHGIVGSSRLMRRLLATVRKVSVVDAPVLILGESGTGKELAAKAIHADSPRAKGPFVAVNCGALPGGLIHSELFGHERGSFTGATGRHVGMLEAAAGGTVFLDEIGDLPLDLQVHLLRFLQEGTIERVGGGRPIRVDARVIAATHVDLDAAVIRGEFREDLLYRLNVLCVSMPPLRERVEDIEPLVQYFFSCFHAERAPGVRGFSRQAMDALERHEWPGNVRELINRVRRAMVMCEQRLITPADLGLERRGRPRQLLTLEKARCDAEREAVLTSLRVARHNVTRAARELGISRVTLYRLMEKHDLRLDASEAGA